jgi:hypothetical protein
MDVFFIKPRRHVNPQPSHHRHAGGTDDPSNIIQLTIDEHAEAHHQLWLHGRWQDLWAWKFLSNNVHGQAEAIRMYWTPERRAEQAIKGRKRMLTNANPMKIHRTNRGSFQKGRVPPPESATTRQKKRQTKLGSLNPNFGKKGCFDHINTTRVVCQHCHKSMTPGNAKRWHLDNCRERKSTQTNAKGSSRPECETTTLS